MKRNFTFLQHLGLSAFFLLSLSSGYGQDYGFEWVVEPRIEFTEYSSEFGRDIFFCSSSKYRNGLIQITDCQKDVGLGIYDTQGNKVKNGHLFYLGEGIYETSNSNFYSKKVTLVNKNLEAIKELNTYSAGGIFSEGLCPVSGKGGFGYMNTKGDLVINLLFDKVGAFKDGIAMVSKGGKTAFINPTGKIISKAFDEVKFDDDKVGIGKIGGKEVLINSSGTELSDTFDLITNEDNGVRAVGRNDKMAFINSSGQFISEWYDYQLGSAYSEGFAIIQKGKSKYSKKYNFIDKDGNLLSTQWFKGVKAFSNDYACVELGYEKWRLLDQQGNLSNEEYSDIEPFNGKYAIAEKNRKTGLIDVKNNLTIPFQYDYIYAIGRQSSPKYYNVVTKNWKKTSFSNLNKVDLFNIETNSIIATVLSGNYSGAYIIDAEEDLLIVGTALYRNKKQITPFYISELLEFSEGYAPIEINKKYGFINEQGEIIVPCIFDAVSSVGEGLAWVSQNGKWGIIRIIPPKLSPDINIEWKTPHLPFDTLTTYNNSQDLSLSIQSEVPLTWEDVQLFVNGNSMDAGKAGEQLKAEGKNGKYYRYSYNTIFVFDSCSTYDIQIKLINKNFIYSGPIQAIEYKCKSNRKLYLISIGTEPEDLKFTGNDARDFIGLFDNQKAIYSRIYKKLLVGKDATAANIKKAINDFANHALLQPNDVIMIFVSSHAYPNGDELYIQANDFNPSSDSMKLNTSVSLREDIKNPLKNIPCKKVLFIDACHSGGYGKGGKATVGSAAAAKIQETALNATGLTYLTSSGTEKSYEYDLYSNGIFTEALVDGLQKGRADVSPNKNESKDDLITITELFNYIAAKVPQLSKTANQPEQLPKMKNQLGDLVIFAVQR